MFIPLFLSLSLSLSLSGGGGAGWLGGRDLGREGTPTKGCCFAMIGLHVCVFRTDCFSNCGPMLGFGINWFKIGLVYSRIRMRLTFSSCQGFVGNSVVVSPSFNPSFHFIALNKRVWIKWLKTGLVSGREGLI